MRIGYIVFIDIKCIGKYINILCWTTRTTTSLGKPICAPIHFGRTFSTSIYTTAVKKTLRPPYDMKFNSMFAHLLCVSILSSEHSDKTRQHYTSSGLLHALQRSVFGFARPRRRRFNRSEI